jgi:hypothetical protein
LSLHENKESRYWTDMPGSEDRFWKFRVFEQRRLDILLFGDLLSLPENKEPRERKAMPRSEDRF